MEKRIEISEYINQLSLDLKAEVLVSVLNQGKNNIKNILVSLDGQLQRTWSKDIAFSETGFFENGDEFLNLHLNRDGIYDALPESIFHGMPEKVPETGEEMARHSMQLKTEEKQSRSFFQPFENAVFNERVKLVQKENQLIRQVLLQGITGVLPDFWNIREEIPEQYNHHFIKLLPLACKIAGKLDLTSYALEFILNEKVTIRSVFNSAEQAGVLSNPSVLGGSILGFDSVLGINHGGYNGCVEVAIGPIENRYNVELAKCGKMESFLECFYGYFLPVEYDVKTKLIFGSETNLFELTDENQNKVSHLGYNTVIL